MVPPNSQLTSPSGLAVDGVSDSSQDPGRTSHLVLYCTTTITRSLQAALLHLLRLNARSETEALVTRCWLDVAHAIVVKAHELEPLAQRAPTAFGGNIG